VRTLKDGKTKSYGATFRGPDRKQHWRFFPKEWMAKEYLVEQVGKVHRKEYRPVTPRLFGEVLDRWLESLTVKVQQGVLKPSTVAGYTVVVNTHIRPTFGHIRSDQIPPGLAKDWEKAQALLIAEQKTAKGSYNLRLTVFRIILKWARKRGQGFLADDPLEEIGHIPTDEPERDYLEPREIDALIRAASSPDDTIIRLFVYAGLRRGEAFALQWDDVDWGNGQDGGRLFVRRNLVNGRLGTPKTKKSIRNVDVPQALLDDLAVYRMMYPPLGTGFLFRDAHGTVTDPGVWSRRPFRRIVRRAGLRMIGVHVLRHTYASLLINAGEPPKYVQQQLGHGSLKITMDLYAHIFPSTSTAAMQRLGQLMTAAKENGKETIQENRPSRTEQDRRR
jgi:integrase